MSIAAMNSVWQIEGLKSAYKLVLMALADAADDLNYCWPSISTLSRKTCMSERNVQRILRSLESLGLIKVESRFRNDGSATTNGYHLIFCGDKLSPPQRRSKHHTVAPTSPPSGMVVTQTTTEPTTNQKIPLQDSKLQKSSGSADYIFPTQLKPEERELAKPQLANLDGLLAQAVLDELAARLNANKVTGAPLSYLRSLICRAKTGQFKPEAGVRVAEAREQAKLAQLKKAAEVIKPTTPSEIPKHLAAMHQVLGRKPTSKQNQKD